MKTKDSRTVILKEQVVTNGFVAVLVIFNRP